MGWFPNTSGRSYKMFVIAGSIALDIEDCMKVPSSLQCIGGGGGYKSMSCIMKPPFKERRTTRSIMFCVLLQFDVMPYYKVSTLFIMDPHYLSCNHWVPT